MCTEHNKPKYFYCDKCDKLYCEVCSVMKDKSHKSKKISEGVYAETVGLMNETIRKLDDLRPVIQNKNEQIKKKIRDFVDIQAVDLNTKAVEEKKNSKEKIKEFSNAEANYIHSYTFQLRDIQVMLDKLIKGDGNFKEADLKMIQNLEKGFEEIKENTQKYLIYEDKRQIDNFLDGFVPSSMIPPVIEIKNLMFEKPEGETKNQFFSCFTHCGKRWKLYLGQQGEEISFFFTIEGLRKPEVNVKLSLEIQHPKDKSKNIYSSINSFNFDNSKGKKQQYLKMLLEFWVSQLKEYSFKEDKLCFVANLKFQYDFFSSFMSELEAE